MDYVIIIVGGGILIANLLVLGLTMKMYTEFAKEKFKGNK